MKLVQFAQSFGGDDIYVNPAYVMHVREDMEANPVDVIIALQGGDDDYVRVAGPLSSVVAKLRRAK